MRSAEYLKLVKKTESMDFVEIYKRMTVSTLRLDHAADGMCTEAGEFKDELKKFKFYGKEIDRINLIEELGDILWYIAIACDEIGVSLEEVMIRNINKLQERYAGKFCEGMALNRDLKQERMAIESILEEDNLERNK